MVNCYLDYYHAVLYLHFLSFCFEFDLSKEVAMGEARANSIIAYY